MLPREIERLNDVSLSFDILTPFGNEAVLLRVSWAMAHSQFGKYNKPVYWMSGKSVFLDGLRVWFGHDLPTDRKVKDTVKSRADKRFLSGSRGTGLMVVALTGVELVHC